MRFHSFFWDGASLSPELERAVDTLNRGRAPSAERQRLLRELLDSDTVAARGIALDHYSLAQAEARQGDVDREFLDAVGDAVRECARRELASPPYHRLDGGEPQRGANHASAFYAMWHLATAADAQRLADALLANDDPAVLEYGLTAAETALFHAEAGAPYLAAVLHRLATSSSLTPELRAGAIVALAASHDDTVVPWLEAALEDRDLAVSGAAACALLNRDPGRFRARIASLAASWPTEGPLPFHAWEVRRMLSKGG